MERAQRRVLIRRSPSWPANSRRSPRNVNKLRARSNALTASDKQLTSSLDALATVETRRVSALEDAQRREREAQRRVTLAQGNVSRAKERVAAAQKLLATSALRQYAGIGTNDVLDTLSAPDTNSADRYGVYARLAAGANADGVDRLRSARQDEDLALTLEKEQSRRAKQARATRATSLADVRAAKRDRERITASIENRLERSLAEAEALASIDGKVSAELTRRQNALIAAIRADEARLAQLRARLGKGAKAGSGGSGSGVYADTPTSGPLVSPPGPQSGSIVSVSGVSVDASIASQLRSLIAAAAADGISLSGGGYRNHANQIALRRARCGSSDFAIFQARASSCRPPTARPGPRCTNRVWPSTSPRAGRSSRAVAAPPSSGCVRMPHGTDFATFQANHGTGRRMATNLNLRR